MPGSVTIGTDNDEGIHGDLMQPSASHRLSARWDGIMDSPGAIVFNC